MRNYKKLLDCIAAYKDSLPDALAKKAQCLADEIFQYSNDKYSQEMSKEDEARMEVLYRELILMQIRENYKNVNPKAVFSIGGNAGWQFDLDEKGDFFIDSTTPCVCGYHKYNKYKARPDEGGYYVCTCTSCDAIPPRECPLLEPLTVAKIQLWITSNMDSIKEFLLTEKPKLIYIAKFPSERYSGFCKKLLETLSVETFKHFLETDRHLKSLCSQLTPNLY